MLDPLEELQTRYSQLCRIVYDSQAEFRIQTEPQHNGSTHVEFSDGRFHYVATERGLELERRSTTDIDEILFWMVCDVAFWSGIELELRNRVEGPDVRRMIFAEWRRLIGKCGPNYLEKLDAKISKTLAENPFIDRN